MGWCAWRCARIRGCCRWERRRQRSRGQRRWTPPLLLSSPPQPLPVPCPQRRYEWFIAGTEPTEVDRSHVEVAVDARTGLPADASTPPQYVQPQTIWLLPPEYAAWARENDVPQLAQMGATPGDAGTRGRGAHADAPLLARGGVGPEASGQVNSPLLLGSPSPPLSLTSPDPNRVYTRDPGLPASAQQVPLTALPRDELSAGTPGDHAAGGRRAPCHRCCTGLYCLVAADGRAAYVPRRRDAGGWEPGRERAGDGVGGMMDVRCQASGDRRQGDSSLIPVSWSLFPEERLHLMRRPHTDSLIR